MSTSGGSDWSPTATALSFCAADRYCSSCVDDTNSRSAMLSNPLLELSAGSNRSRSTSFERFVEPSRSRIAFLYSVRVRRWNSGSLPGSGPGLTRPHPASPSRCEATASYVAASGRGRPAGGIAPDRSFRTTFSHGSSVSTWIVRIQLLEREPAGANFFVMTGHAIFVESGRGRGAGGGRGAAERRRRLWRLLRTQISRRAEDQGN